MLAGLLKREPKTGWNFLNVGASMSAARLMARAEPNLGKKDLRFA
jgi:hypothetical protein